METDNVYVIQACQGGPVKIGRSVDVDRRLTEVQPGHPFELRVARLFEGVDPAFESWLHTRFADYRLHGEWFEEEVLTAIDTEDVLGAFESGRPSYGVPEEIHVIGEGFSARCTSYGAIAMQATRAGSTGRITLPRSWGGKRVMALLMEPIEDDTA